MGLILCGYVGKIRRAKNYSLRVTNIKLAPPKLVILLKCVSGAAENFSFLDYRMFNFAVCAIHTNSDT